MQSSLWDRCVQELRSDLSEQQFNTWIRPLQAIEDERQIRLLAPNRFVVDWVNSNCLGRIQDSLRDAPGVSVRIEVGSTASPPRESVSSSGKPRVAAAIGGRLNGEYTFENFVEGKSNQLARAAAMQVGSNPGMAYNPLFIYGGVGLGKTHLMHAIGNLVMAGRPEARVAYVHSEQFVGDMVRALQHNTINGFKAAYRSLDALLIDDIQFFANKERSQEEFFHTFNALLEGQRQVILTCDRFPEGGQRPGGAPQVTLRLGTDCSHRATGARDQRGDSDEQGCRPTYRAAGRGGVLHCAANSFERSRT